MSDDKPKRKQPPPKPEKTAEEILQPANGPYKPEFRKWLRDVQAGRKMGHT